MCSRRTPETRAFRDRSDAGRRLADELECLAAQRPLILGLARGGVVIADKIAGALHTSVYALVARKLGAPSQPELGIGAIAPGGVVAVNDELVDRLGLTDAEVSAIADREGAEVERRLQSYTAGAPMPSLEGRVVIIADDGLATGYTALAAVRYARLQNPKKIILAVPVCAPQAVEMLRKEADEVVCVIAPADLVAVGYWYQDFAQVSDQQVLEILAGVTSGAIQIPIPGGTIQGDLAVPAGSRGLVIFAHGSGSGRHSSRNKLVAEHLNHGRIATLLIDLLTEEEEAADRSRFDIDLLAGRLEAAIRWAASDALLSPLQIGLFGASTGAAAALTAAARLPEVRAVVSRGGRPDLAGSALGRVEAPTLLIVGRRDETVVELNQEAYNLLSCEKKLEIVPGATHLFPEPGALAQVCRLAEDWFLRYLG